MPKCNYVKLFVIHIYYSCPPLLKFFGSIIACQLILLGYISMNPNFITPYRELRYHLSEFQDGNLPTNPKEPFNHHHSSLCKVIAHLEY